MATRIDSTPSAEVDINKIIAEVVAIVASSTLSRIHSGSVKAKQKAINVFRSTFTDYITRAYSKHSVVKTILYRDKPVPLAEFYVETSVLVEGQRVEITSARDLFTLGHFIVVTGTAGSGKSTFVKSIFLRLVQERYERIPLFIELRHLNTEDSISLIDHIYNQVSAHNSNFSLNYLEDSLVEGNVVLVLDGFDELKADIKKEIEKQILSMSEVYAGTAIIVSSRPDDKFTGWQEFSELRVLPLSKEKAVELVSKIQYDDVVKTTFLSELKRGLFEKHKSFLSNPLLLTIMLLTYEQIAEIPSKMHIYYERAFETLFNKHDATKSLYRRQSQTGLPIDEFRKLVAGFSFVSYMDREYTMSQSSALQYAKKASVLTHIQVEPRKLVEDLLEAVCVLSKDGMMYTYTHRSFQEYFTAVFLNIVESNQKRKLIRLGVRSNAFDNVFGLLSEMNRELVEREYLIPELQAFLAEVAALKRGVYKYIRILDMLYDGIIIDPSPNDRIGYALGERGASANSIISHCNELFEDRFGKHVWQPVKLDSAAMKVVDRMKLASGHSPDLHWDYFVLFDNPDRELNEFLIAIGAKERLERLIAALTDILAELEDKYASSEKNIEELLGI